MSKIESKKSEKSGQGFIHSVEHRKLFIDWLSGLVGGFVSVTCCAPLDLARTRHMVLVFFNFQILNSRLIPKAME